MIRMKTNTTTSATLPPVRPSVVSAVLVAILLGLCTLFPGDLRAQEVSLSSLLELAERQNPELAAGRRSAEAAAARVPQAGALPDPVLGVGIMNVPIADPSLGRDMMTMTTIQLGEQFPWPGKLGLREEMARLTAEAALWEVERRRLSVLTEVKESYYRIYFLDRALEVTTHNETLVGDFARLTSAKYGVGTGTQPDILKAQIERTRLTDQVVTLTEQRTAAAARLNALLGRPTDTPVPGAELPPEIRVAALEADTPRGTFTAAPLAGVGLESDTAPGRGVPGVAELQGMALAENPMIQAHGRRVVGQERALALARKATLPDFNVSMAYSLRPDFGDFVNVMVSLPLPVFSGRKQDQGVAEQTALLAQHQATHDAMVDELNGTIASLVAELRRARDQLVLLADGILPQARTSLSSATASYQVGRVDFLTLLDAQVTLYRHELDYHRLLADFASNLAALERAVGTEVLR